MPSMCTWRGGGEGAKGVVESRGEHQEGTER